MDKNAETAVAAAAVAQDAASAAIDASVSVASDVVEVHALVEEVKEEARIAEAEASVTLAETAVALAQETTALANIEAAKVASASLEAIQQNEEVEKWQDARLAQLEANQSKLLSMMEESRAQLLTMADLLASSQPRSTQSEVKIEASQTAESLPTETPQNSAKSEEESPARRIRRKLRLL